MKNGKKRLTSVIRTLNKAFGEYKYKIALLIMLGFISGLFEGIGINTLIPLLSSVIGDESLGSDFITTTINTFFNFVGIDFSLKYLLIFTYLLFLSKAIVQIICDYIGVHISVSYEEQTKKTIFKDTLNSNWNYLLKQKIGYLENVLTVDISMSAILIRYIVSLIMISTSLILYFFIAINISPIITILTLVIGVLLLYFSKSFAFKIKTLSNERVSLNKKITHFVNESILGLKTIISSSSEEKIYKIGTDYFSKIKKIAKKTFIFSNISSAALQPISLLYISIVFAISYKTETFHFASMIAVVYLIQKMFQQFQQFQRLMYQTQTAIPYLQSVLRYKEEISKNTQSEQGTKDYKFNNKLSFKNVSFSYNNNKKILQNINFDIKKGATVGLIGPSGAGKTTIVDLVLRLLNTNKGTILIDNHDISEININQWRGKIGYISQDIFLLNDTIENNIKFFRELSNEDMELAAKNANIFDFINDLPEKFSTIVGERGIEISAGQRQRLVIARILAQKPEILILDEATSALDNKSESKIQKVIENLSGKITILIIAHRLSTLKNVDKIIILENNKIIAQEKPEELLKNKDNYFYKSYNIRK